MKNLCAVLKKYSIESYFYFLFSLAVVARIFCDIELNRIGIHSGNIFPYRKLFPENQPYPLFILYCEWTVAFIGALLLNFRHKRIGATFITISLIMSLSQMYSNQKTLMFLIALTLTILPLSRKNQSSLWFLKNQLLIVYLFAAFHKAISQFDDGRSLMTTFQYLITLEKNGILRRFLLLFLNSSMMNLFSWITILLQFSIPLFLLKKPKIGIVLVFFLHISFNVFLKDILPFTLSMMALSFLFLIPESVPAK